MVFRSSHAAWALALAIGGASFARSAVAQTSQGGAPPPPSPQPSSPASPPAPQETQPGYPPAQYPQGQPAYPPAQPAYQPTQPTQPARLPSASPLTRRPARLPSTRSQPSYPQGNPATLHPVSARLSPLTRRLSPATRRSRPTSNPLTAMPSPPLPPPPPKRKELSWSIRVNALDPLFGKLSGELEYAFAGPFSVVVAPQYIFGDPRQNKSLGITASGAGVYGELGFWLQGRPLQGYFLKAHVEHRSVTFRSHVDELTIPATLIGAMFGSQSDLCAAGSRSLAGVGIAYDLKSQERSMHYETPTALDSSTYVFPAPGLLQNGFDLITQLSLGGSF